MKAQEIVLTVSTVRMKQFPQLASVDDMIFRVKRHHHATVGLWTEVLKPEIWNLHILEPDGRVFGG